MSMVWVLQEVENSYEAPSTILAIFECMPSEAALRNAGVGSTLATELVERHYTGCGAYILDAYELTRGF